MTETPEAVKRLRNDLERELVDALEAAELEMEIAQSQIHPIEQAYTHNALTGARKQARAALARAERETV